MVLLLWFCICCAFWLVGMMGPMGPLIALGGVGLFLVICTLPFMLQRKAEPFERLKQKSETGRRTETAVTLRRADDERREAERIARAEAEARQRHGDAVQVYRAGFRPMLNALAQAPQRSLFKVVCVGSDQRVVGIHLMGDAADEILQGFAVAIRRGITLQDLRDTVAIHPTSAEEVVLMR